MATACQPTGVPRLLGGAPGQAARSSWASRSRRIPSGPRAVSSTGGCSTTSSTGGPRSRCRPQSDVPREPGLVVARPRGRRLQLDRRQRQHEQRLQLPADRQGRQPGRVHLELLGSSHHDYRLGLPAAGEWTEILNTDAEVDYRLGGRQHGHGDRDRRAMARPTRVGGRATPSARSVWFLGCPQPGPPPLLDADLDQLNRAADAGLAAVAAVEDEELTRPRRSARSARSRTPNSSCAVPRG